MRFQFLDRLRGEVEQHFGRKIISSNDCIQLASEIFIKTGVKVNHNTLRRCFQLVKTDYLPSYTSLNLLSQYCSFASFDDFVQHQKKNNGQLSVAKDHQLLNYLTTLFRHLEVKDPTDETFLNFVQETIHFFLKEPSIVDEFQKIVAKTKNGQNFYFEQLVHIDQLNGYFGEGLRYYLAEIKTEAGKMYGHAVLAFRYWLSNNENAFHQHGTQVLLYTLNSTTPPHFSAWHFTLRLLHACTHQQPLTPIIREAKEYFGQIASANAHGVFFTSYLLLLSEVLLLTGEPEEALFYIQCGQQQQHNLSVMYKEVGRYPAFELYEAIALFQLGQYEKSQEVYAKIKAEKFCFLSKKYHTILYLQLCDGLQKRKIKYEQIEHLIKETGFVRLYPIFNLTRK